MSKTMTVKCRNKECPVGTFEKETTEVVVECPHCGTRNAYAIRPQQKNMAESFRVQVEKLKEDRSQFDEENKNIRKQLNDARKELNDARKELKDEKEKKKG